MQHSPRFLNYTTDRVRRHQRLKVAEESIIPTRSDQTDAVAATFLNIDSDFAARVHGQHRKGKAYSANPWAPAARCFFAEGSVYGLAKVPCQDADCERLIGVNVYGSGARLVITVAH
jgi:hypothetical protein